MKIHPYLQLIRVHQWYKNLVVFLALFFSQNATNSQLAFDALLAFISMCFLTSFGYIINDLKDRAQDQLHPEKKRRPLASGKVPLSGAIIAGGILLVVGFFLAGYLGAQFTAISSIFLAISLLYSLSLKKVMIADVLTISTLFVLRAMAGAVAIEVWISPWLILVPFFLSLFIAVGKRHADIIFLREKAYLTRQVLEYYNVRLTNALMIISTTLLVISYALYSFLSEHENLLATLPFSLFVVFRYYHLIDSGSIIARHPHKIFNDRALITGIGLWVAITISLLYYYA